MIDFNDNARVLLANAEKLLQRWQGLLEYSMGDDNSDRDHNGINGIDCSAFAERCAGRRKFDGRLWWNTDRIYADALGSDNVRWHAIRRPINGCVGVYPGKIVNGKRRAGHVFVVRNVETCATIESSSMARTVTVLRRPDWFVAGARGNGKSIVWAVPVNPKLLDD